jgi:hypothetical protein
MLLPEQELWCEVIKRAVEDGDLTFILGEAFEEVCDLLQIDAKMIRDRILALAENRR